MASAVLSVAEHAIDVPASTASTGATSTAGAETRTAAAQPAVTCRGLSVRFFTDRKSVTALSGIDLDIARGEFLTLLGPSGCGKSTLLRAVADLVSPSKGDIRILGDSAAAARSKRQ